MDMRRLPPGQGIEWFRQAINLGARNPRAVFGAALLLIASLHLIAMLLVVVTSLAGDAPAPGSTPSLGRTLALAMPLFVLLMLAIPVLLGGLMHVIREVEAGRPVRAFDLFAPARDAAGRRVAVLGVVQIAIALLGGLAMLALAGGDYWQQYQEAVNSMLRTGQIAAMPQPAHPMLLSLVQLVLNYISAALMLLALPLMLFSGQALLPALRDSLRASTANVGANLLAGVLFVGALVAGGLLAMLLTGGVAMLGNAVHPALGALLGVAGFLAFASAVLVLVAGGSYLAWRDTFGEGAAPPPLPPNRIEV